MISKVRSNRFSSRSCTRCYERKVKCDRQRPCNSCIKLEDACIVPNTPIRRQRQKKRANESHRPLDIRKDDRNSDTLDTSLNSYPVFDGNVFLKHHQPKETEKCWMPTFDQIQTSWRIYTRNIDPFHRILHKPSVYRLIIQVKDQGLSILCKEELALILSICFASVTSLTTEQCISTFGQTTAELYERSRNSAELAVWRAGLLQKPDIRALQAFSIILSCCSQTHPQSKWALIGTAIRIARSLELHRENKKLTLSFFQMEMRRRLWWHLRVLDFMNCLLLNCFESSDSFLDCDTIFPLNISDSELDPTGDTVPMVHQGATEMSFCLLRYDICAKVFTILNQYRFNNAILTSEIVEQLIQDLSLHLDKQYLQLFERDPATPLFRLCSVICQHIPTRIRILLNSFEKPLPYLYSATAPFPSLSEIEGNVFISSINLLDFHIQFPNDQDFDGWNWLFGLSKHWRVMESLLSQLDSRLRDLDDVSKPQYWDTSGNHYILLAWKAVEKAFASISIPRELHDIWRKLESRRNDIKTKLLIMNLHP